MSKNYVLSILLLQLIGNTAQAVVHRLQLCPSKCKTQACKKLADEVEFEFELSKDFLLPPCAKAKAALKEREFRVEFSDDPSAGDILVEVQCRGAETCLSKKYKRKMRETALTAAVVSDVKVVMTQRPKIQEKIPTPPSAKDDQEEEKQTLAPVALEEWDRVILQPPKEALALDVPVVTTQGKEPGVPLLGSITMSFGAENWNYFFAAEKEPERIAPIHSRIYPRALFSASVWPTSFLRLSTNMAASVLSFRLRTNQPVEGDGQLVMAQMYQSDLMASFLKPLFGIVHLGFETGYDFQAAMVDKQRLADRDLTVVPSFQSHALRVGPRVVIGALTDKGVIDIGAGFYPYVYYFESPDEPSSKKSVFAWSVHGLVRLMLGTEMFADAAVKASSFYVQYEDEPQRENVSGEKWGTGKVTNSSASAAVGLGWLF